jgi:putative exporter of polyketide antibiotics
MAIAQDPLPSTRAALCALGAGTAGIVALAAYLLNVLAELWPRIRPYGKLSPFHYYQPMAIIGGGVSTWAADVGILLAIAACLVGVAFVAFSRRDL